MATCNNHGVPKGGIDKASNITVSTSCAGHRLPRPSGLNQATIDAMYTQGSIIDAIEYNNLKAKIRAELQTRLSHTSYSSNSRFSNSVSKLTSIYHSVNKADKTQGDKLKDLNEAELSMGATNSPSDVLRGAAVVFEPAAPNSINNNQLKLNSPPYTTSGYPAGNKNNQHSPPYAQLKDRSNSGRSVIDDIAAEFDVGKKMEIDDFRKLHLAYERLRSDCICHSDCNCNAVCACHNNCGCHY